MSVMEIKAQKTIEKYNMLFKGAKVVVGLSGGADSTALLLFLCSLKEKYDLSVYAVHINHGIRGKEADNDSKFSEELCKKMGVECRICNYDVRQIAKGKGISEEEAGRFVRYNEFEAEKSKRNADFIAVAHNMNDQAETLIMRMSRGSGSTGIAGIRPVRGSVIRPLIDCSRSDIEEYLNERGQEFCTDSTNLKEEYTRNKIRLNVIPYLKKEINSSADENIAKTAMLIRQEDEFLNKLAKEKLENIIISKSEKEVSLNADKLNEEEDVLKNRILRLAVMHIKPDIKDLSHSHMEFMFDTAKKGGRCDLPGGIKSETSCGVMKIYLGDKQEISYSYILEEDKEVFVSQCGLYVLMTKKYKNDNFIYTKAIKCDKIKGTVLIRNRADGDKITTDLNGKTKKLKDIFIDRKIPRDERNMYPVIADDDGIISVLGIRDGIKIMDCKENGDKMYIFVWRG